MAKRKIPATNVEEIRSLKTELGRAGFYKTKIKEQEEDQKYHDDTFTTAITEPYHMKRTGSGARIIDIACESIDTSNPVVSCEPRKKAEKEEERAVKRSKLLNHWVKLIQEEIDEAKKNSMLRGEAWFQVEYNEDYDSNDKTSLPIVITAPDPMIIFGDPHEAGGVPRRLIKSCNMNVGQVQQLFPDWGNPQHKKPGGEGVDYLAYWDAETRYIEADKEGILGPQKNIFKFVPFVHCYSGFGKRSPEGKPETKAVGRLRRIRGRLIEECEIESRIDSIIGLFANPVLKIQQVAPDVQAGEAPNEDELKFAPGSNITVPFGWQIDIYQPEVPNEQMYFHLYQIKSALGLETPPVSLGLPSTSRSTGRQEDIYIEQYSRQYRTLKNNLARALSTALSMALRIVDTVPGTLPITIRATTVKDGKKIDEEETITKADIDGYYDCRVEFRSSDLLAEDRKVMLGRTLVNEGRIDWRSFLIDYCGYSQEKADETINQTIADQVIFSPQMMSVISKEALEKAGLQRYIKEMETQAQMQAQMMQATPVSGQPRPSEARNPVASGITRQLLEQTPVGVRRQPNAPQSTR